MRFPRFPFSLPSAFSLSPAAAARNARRRAFNTMPLVAGLLLALLPAAASTTAQAQAAPRQVLHKHVRHAVTDKSAAFVSALPADQQLQLSIVLPLRNASALDALLAKLYDPASASYRKFLSVDEFTAQFGPTADDYQAVIDYAKSNGFTVTGTAANRMVVSIAGTAAQVDSAFHVQMGLYQHPAEQRTFFSPDAEPSLALNVPVAHISGLDNYSLPRHFTEKPRDVQANAGNVTGSGPAGSYLGSDMRAAYYGGKQLTGIGQTIGILEYGGYLQSDVDKTFTNAGQSYTVPIVNVLLDGQTAGPQGEDAEQALDIAQAIGMAPGLQQVRVYIGNNDTDMLNSMAFENLAKQLSCSWGWLPVDPQLDDPFFKEMAAQGQSFFTASGDSGAYDTSVSPYVYPSDDAYVTSVGGTHLTTTGAGGPWASEVAWSGQGAGSGGGISTNSIAIPTWQAGIANSANGGSTTLRNAPDVAMEGDFDNYACNLGTCSAGYAGTSFAAPRWAGFMALVNQQAVEAGTTTTGLGFINPTIYSLGQGSHAASDLHDIVSGNNRTNNQSVFYNAVAGYDLVTGFGSANGQALIDDLAGPQVPGFWLSSSKQTVVVNPGSTGATTLSVTDAGSFTGNVSFAITSTLPSGVTAAFSPASSATATELTFTADSNVAAQNVTVTVTGTSGTLTASTTFTVAIHAPSFALSATPATVGINQNASGTATITVTPQYNFAGSVDLSVSGLPAGVTGSFSPTSTTGTSTLTLAVSSTATPGNSTITVTGISGSLTAMATFTLSIHGPSFTLYGPTTVDVGQGATTTASLQVYGQYGFNGSVNFAVTGLPAGVTAAFSPNPSSNYTTLTLTASSAAAAGNSTVTVTGTSGSLTSSTSFSLGVHAPSFTLSTGSTVSIGQGNSGSTYVSVYQQYGFNGSVNLSVTGLPAGVTALWSPNPTTNSSTLTLTASATAATGQYPLTITGTSGALTATASLTLGVYVPTFTLSGGGNVSIGQGASGTSYLYVNDQYGFTGNVTLSVSGLPAGVTATFSPNPTSFSSTITFQATSAAAIGQYTATITGTSGTQTATTKINVGVFTPTFTLSSYGNVNLGRGNTASTSVAVYNQYGFNGSVTLSVSGLPTGVTASFLPNPTTGSSNLTLTASSTAALGQYTLVVTGTSGSITASTNITLGVFNPTFTLSAGSANIGQGSTSSSYVFVSPQYGFTGNVTLAISGLPTGVTAAFTPNPTTSNSTLTFSASGTAATGQYPLTITGTSGSTTVTTTTTLSVFVPSFTLSAGYASVGQGSSTTTYVNVFGQYGFNSPVNLAVTGLPAGVTATFTPNPATGYTQLAISASAAAPVGTSTLTITGTSGSTTASTTTQLSIYAPSFTLYDGNSVAINQGASGTSTVSITPQYGFSGNVTLATTGLPAGVTASFAPNPATTSSVLTLTAGSTATPGVATVTITGTSGSVTASTTLQLTVYAPAFTLTAAPAQVNVGVGGTGSATVTPVPVHGFAGSVTYTVAPLPAGVTASFSPNPATGNSTLTLTASSTAVTGVTALTVTGTSGSLSATAPLTVNVFAAPSATVTTLTLKTGSTTATTVAAGTAVTATATVAAGTTALTAGQINLCDSTASICDESHRIGTAQITAAGTATVRFVPGVGSHSYVAFFTGVSGKAASKSAAVSLTVTGSPAPSTTTLTQTGTPSNYTLTAVVSGAGPVAPGGAVNFLETSNGNASVGATALTAGAAVLTRTTTQSPAVGSYPVGAATADFNGDGIPDIAVANTSSNSISILLGKGDGTFTAATALSVSSNLGVPVVGDFNADGKTDIAVPLPNSNSLAIFLGAGDGSFTRTATNPVTGSSPSSLAVGDYNGDGIQDIAVSNSGSSTVTTLLGNGDGSFTAANLSPQVGSYPSLLKQADFNGDGFADLISISNSYDGSIYVLLGNGDGSFSKLPAIPASTYLNALAIGDLNGDGKLDLVVSGQYGGSASVFLGNGDGSFAAGQPVVLTSGYAYNAAGSLAIADLNGDGKADLAFPSSPSNSVNTVFGNGDGTFGAATSFPTGTSPNTVLVGDWNSDGVPDLATTNTYSNTVTVLTTKLSQTASAKVTVTTPGATGAHTFVGSYPGDANFASSTSGSVTIGTATIAPTVTVGFTPAAISTVQALTVNVGVSGGSGKPVATGSVVLGSGGYTSAAVSLSAGAAAIVIPAGTLPVGTDAVTATYTPDTASQAIYTGATGTGSVTVSKAVPVVSLSLSAASITSAQALTVTVGVTAGAGNTVPAGSVVLTGGGYTSAATALANGSATITVPAGSLALGPDALQVAYTPSGTSAAVYASANATGSVTVTAAIGTNVPSVTVKASATTVLNAQPSTITVTVAGVANQPAPTGSVTLANGKYSMQMALASGAAVFSVPTSALDAGANTLTASYAGDAAYAPATGSVTITVVPVALTATMPAAVAAGASATSTITLSSGVNYTGAMALTCALTSSPAGAQSLPACTVSPASVNLSASGSATATLTVTTTAASKAALQKPAMPGRRALGYGGSVLALVLLVGAPRRSRLAALLMLLLTFGAFGISGCAGGGGGSSTPTPTPTPTPPVTGSSTPATTSGTYVFTVTGTDSAAKVTAATNVNVTVQ